MQKLKNVSPFVVIGFMAAVSLVSSFWQTVVKINLLKNPELPLSCDINPVVDCGSVLNNDLSAVFGVPNSMIGMVMFAALLVLALMFWRKPKQPKEAKLAFAALGLIALGFVVWFFAVSLYTIGKICIFCIFIWTSVVPMTILILRELHTELLPKKTLKAARTMLEDRPLQYIVGIYLLAILLFLYRFRDYYF